MCAMLLKHFELHLLYEHKALLSNQVNVPRWCVEHVSGNLFLKSGFVGGPTPGLALIPQWAQIRFSLFIMIFVLLCRLCLCSACLRWKNTRWDVVFTFLFVPGGLFFELLRKNTWCDYLKSNLYRKHLEQPIIKTAEDDGVTVGMGWYQNVMSLLSFVNMSLSDNKEDRGEGNTGGMGWYQNVITMHLYNPDNHQMRPKTFCITFHLVRKQIYLRA